MEDFYFSGFIYLTELLDPGLPLLQRSQAMVLTLPAVDLRPVLRTHLLTPTAMAAMPVATDPIYMAPGLIQTKAPTTARGLFVFLLWNNTQMED